MSMFSTSENWVRTPPAARRVEPLPSRALLDQHHIDSGLGEVECGARADHSAADHDHGRGRGGSVAAGRGTSRMLRRAHGPRLRSTARPRLRVAHRMRRRPLRRSLTPAAVAGHHPRCTRSSRPGALAWWRGIRSARRCFPPRAVRSPGTPHRVDPLVGQRLQELRHEEPAGVASGAAGQAASGRSRWPYRRRHRGATAEEDRAVVAQAPWYQSASPA